MIDVVPHNPNQREILQVLTDLKTGEHIGGPHDFGLLKPTAANVRTNLAEAVKDSLRKGPHSDKVSIWLVAPRGGGKTQTLARIENDLVFEENLEGLDKLTVVSRINLGVAHNRYELQEAIFEKATIAGQSTFRSEIDRSVEAVDK